VRMGPVSAERAASPGLLALEVRWWHRALFDREERFPRRAIEDEHEPALRDLGDGVHTCAVACDGDEIRRAGGRVPQS